MLEEGVRDHGHERMTVKALPGPSLEVVKRNVASSVGTQGTRALAAHVQPIRHSV
jgi:hypothetical protein